MSDSTPGSSGLPPEFDPRARRPGAGARRAAASTARAGDSRRPPGGPGSRAADVHPAHTRGRTAARILSWLAVLTSVTVLLASGTGYFLYQNFSSSLERINAFAGIGGDRPESGRAENFLLVGSDSREGATEEELQAANTTYEAGRRSDTTILVHIPPGQDRALLVSIPRDAFVEIPSFTDPDTGETVAARSNKFNEAYSVGGPALTIKTVEQLTRIHIDHYLEVDFTGFQRMVDALDGVEVCLPEAARDSDSGLDLPAGYSTVQGEQALAFVRARKVFGGNDIDRIGRQQQFLAAMLARVTDAGVLLRPDRLLDFLGVVGESVRADDDFGFAQMRTLATRMRNLDPARVTFVTMPFSDVDYTPSGYRGSFVRVDEEASEELFRAIRTSSYFAEEEPAAPLLDPRDVRVEVLNGAGIAGLGREVSDDLAGRGFDVATPGNADSSDATGTVVRHAPGAEDAGRTVAALIPDATLREDRSLDDTVVVVAGSDYDGLAAEAEEAREDPAMGLNPRTAADDPCAGPRP